MPLTVEDLIAVQQTASGLVKDEIDRLLKLRKETDEKIKDLGGLEHSAEMLALAEEATAKATELMRATKSTTDQMQDDAHAALAHASQVLESIQVREAELRERESAFEDAQRAFSAEREQALEKIRQREIQLQGDEEGSRRRATALGEAEEGLRRKLVTIRELLGV